MFSKACSASSGSHVALSSVGFDVLELGNSGDYSLRREHSPSTWKSAGIAAVRGVGHPDPLASEAANKSQVPRRVRAIWGCTCCDRTAS